MIFSKKKTNEDDSFKAITESLYKQNLELAVKNKTLSLLGKLYKISILALKPEDLAEKITNIIQTDFNFELVGVFLYDQEKDSLLSLAFTESDRFKTSQADLNISFDKNDIPNISKNTFLKQIIEGKKMGYTKEINDVWNDLLSKEVYEKLEKSGHVNSSIVYPLIIENKTIGILILSLNRSYDDLVDYEKDSIHSFIDVITVALDKSLIYRQLNITNTELESANIKLKELDKLKTEFLSFASHQIKNPLSAVRGYASMLLEGDYGQLTHDTKEVIAVIEESTQSLMSVVQDFLDVTKIEQGGMKYDMQDFDLEELINNIISELSPNAKTKGLTLDFIRNEKEKFIIKGDSNKLRQVFLNLIDNSIKYTKQGGLKVLLEKNKNNIVFSVTDTGVGILKEDIDKLFAKFSRADNANKTNINGTGLGLYLARQIIEAHKGKIWIESPGINKGSTFFVELPL